MKNLSLILLALTFTSTAWSSELMIKRLYTHDPVSGVFDFDEETSRAWVELEISPRFSDIDDNDYERVKVPGLTLEGDIIRFDLEGQSFECAKLKKRGLIFRANVAVKTGQCTFEYKKQKITVDDGFRLRKVRVTDVYIQAQK